MKSIKTVLITSVVVTTSLLTGCATIVSGSQQTVNIQAINANNHHLISSAKCVIVDSRGVYYAINSNPGSISLPREYGGLNVDCRAKGYWQQSIGTGSSFNAWTLGDIIFWPGAIVDAATGAVKEYPSHITVLMSTHPVKHPQTRLKAK